LTGPKGCLPLFARKGFDGTRIAEIAGASGPPKASVYYYFESKEAVYATLIERLLQGWEKALDHIRADREPREAIAV
jgi:TetR/AcrR family transcriptional regulator